MSLLQSHYGSAVEALLIALTLTKGFGEQASRRGANLDTANELSEESREVFLSDVGISAPASGTRAVEIDVTPLLELGRDCTSTEAACE